MCVSSGGVDLTFCHLLYKDLSAGLEGLLLSSFLHLLYLVTPYELVPQCSPNWMIYLRQVCRRSGIGALLSAPVC